MLSMAISHSMYSSAPIYHYKSVDTNNLSLLEDNKRQHKSIIPINYLGCGQGKNKALNSQASYHGLTSVLTKATGDAIGQ